MRDGQESDLRDINLSLSVACSPSDILVCMMTIWAPNDSGLNLRQGESTSRFQRDIHCWSRQGVSASNSQEDRDEAANVQIKIRYRRRIEVVMKVGKI